MSMRESPLLQCLPGAVYDMSVLQNSAAPYQSPIWILQFSGTTVCNSQLRGIAVEAVKAVINDELSTVLSDVLAKYGKRLLVGGFLITLLNIAIVGVAIWFVIDYVGPILSFIQDIQSDGGSILRRRLGI